MFNFTRNTRSYNHAIRAHHQTNYAKPTAREHQSKCIGYANTDYNKLIFYKTKEKISFNYLSDPTDGLAIPQERRGKPLSNFQWKGGMG